MHCPNCVTTRLIVDSRHGIEVDYCPQCRGVWLDRGEIEKVIAGPARHGAGAAHARAAGPGPDRGRRRRSWLDTIFD